MPLPPLLLLMVTSAAAELATAQHSTEMDNSRVEIMWT
jgi:hypothetical protein